MGFVPEKTNEFLNGWHMASSLHDSALASIYERHRKLFIDNDL